MSGSLIKNGIQFTVGKFLIQGISFITIPIFTRLLTPFDYGKSATYTTWYSVIIVIISLVSHGSIQNAKITYEKKEFEKYRSNISLIYGGMFVLSLTLLFIFQDIISKFIELDKSLIYLMLGQAFFSCYLTIELGIKEFEGQAKSQLLISLATTVLNVFLSYLLIKKMNDKYYGRITGSAIPTILFGFYFAIKTYKNRMPIFNKKHIVFCLSLTLPLIFHIFSSIILNASDRVMLQKIVGFESLGSYSFMYNIGMVINLLWAGCNAAWVPWYYKKMHAKDFELIEATVKRYIKLFTILTALFILFSPELVKIMAPKQYWEGLNFLPLISLGYYFVFLYSLPVNCEYFFNKTKFIAIGTMLAATINIGLNFLLIPKLNSLGAALATVLSFVLLFIFHEIIVSKILKSKFIKNKTYFLNIFFILLIAGSYYIFLDKIYLRYSIFFMIGLYGIYEVRDLLRKLLKKV